MAEALTIETADGPPTGHRPPTAGRPDPAEVATDETPPRRDPDTLTARHHHRHPAEILADVLAPVALLLTITAHRSPPLTAENRHRRPVALLTC